MSNSYVGNTRINQARRLGGEIDLVSKKYEYSGSHAREYKVCLPSRYSTTKKYPLVMVLHGCLQEHTDIQTISGFDRLADKHQFILVYPFVTRYSGIRAKNCWAWWVRKHIRPGAGESEDLKNIISDVVSQYAVDPSRLHICGLSSGGAMALATAVASKNLFASCAVVAGVSYGERITAVKLPGMSRPRYRGVDNTVSRMAIAREGDRTVIPLCIVHSYDDESVDIQAAKNLRDSWLDYFGINEKSAKASYRYERGYAYSHTRYGKWYRSSVLETYFLENLGHGWSGGQAGAFSYPEGPDISKKIWAFFSGHRKK